MSPSYGSYSPRYYLRKLLECVRGVYKSLTWVISLSKFPCVSCANWKARASIIHAILSSQSHSQFILSSQILFAFRPTKNLKLKYEKRVWRKNVPVFLLFLPPSFPENFLMVKFHILWRNIVYKTAPLISKTGSRWVKYSFFKPSSREIVSIILDENWPDYNNLKYFYSFENISETDKQRL